VSRRARFLRSPRGAVGFAIVVFVVLVALIGPYVTPYSPTKSVAGILQHPSASYLLGTDFLGRDVLSRLLAGGRSVLAMGLAATLLGYLIGLTVGLTAGYTRSITDSVLMRSVDVLLAFPPLLFLLVLIAGAGRGVGVLIIGVAVIQAPAISRIVRAATLEVATRGYVEAAVARGENPVSIILRDVLPNILGPVLVDAGLRFTYSILIMASVNFLGLGLEPPSSDWALMIGENRSYIALNSLAIVAPAAMLALLTIGVNLVGDAIAASLGRSYVRPTKTVTT
jgi:peptide/nickel transport system permease protein